MSITSVSSRSELDALNTMLLAVSQRPVDTYDTNANLHTINARNTLEDAYRRLLLRGWRWNTEVNKTLTRDGSNEITLAADILNVSRVRNTKYGHCLDIVAIGSKLYDRENNVFTFDKDKVADLVVSRAWSEVPPEAQEFVTYRATRLFVKNVLNDASIVEDLIEEEARAFRELERHESETGNINLLENNEAHFRRDRMI